MDRDPFEQVGLDAYREGADPADVRKSPLRGPFTVEVKRSARRACKELAAIVDERGPYLAFDSREDAESFVARATVDEDEQAEIRLQSVAPQDDTPADAYVVAQPERHSRAPEDPEAATWRFHTDANQYGSLGQALLTTPASDPPALTHYVQEDLDVDAADLRVVLCDPRPATTSGPDGTVLTWLPDVLARARRTSTGGTVREYWCEVKTGSASLERHQLAVMRAKARDPDVTVLQARVDVEGLPDSYAVRFADVLE